MPVIAEHTTKHALPMYSQCVCAVQAAAVKRLLHWTAHWLPVQRQLDTRLHKKSLVHTPQPAEVHCPLVPEEGTQVQLLIPLHVA